MDSIVGLVVGGAPSCALSISKFAVGFRETSFELIPSFVGGTAWFPEFAVFKEQACCMYELKSIVGDLLGSVWREASGSVVNIILDLIK